MFARLLTHYEVYYIIFLEAPFISQSVLISSDVNCLQNAWELKCFQVTLLLFHLLSKRSRTFLYYLF